MKPFLITVAVILSTNVFNFLFENLETAPYLITSPDPFYPLDNWNLSNHQRIDLDGNGIKEHISYEGCLTIDHPDEYRLPPADCSRQNQVKIHPRPTPPVILSHNYLTQKDSTWQLVRHYNGWPTTYQIDTNTWIITKTTTPLLTRIDELIYIPTHILLHLPFWL